MKKSLLLLLLGFLIGVTASYFWCQRNILAVIRTLSVTQSYNIITDAESLRKGLWKNVLDNKEVSLPLIVKWYKEFKYDKEPDLKLLHRIKDYRDKWGVKMPNDINAYLNALPPTLAILQLNKFSANLGKPIEIKYTSIDGRKVDLADLKGKVVLVDFWATWCGPCVGEVPEIKATYAKYHDKGFEIVGISFDQDKDRLQQFIKENEMPWPHYFDGKGWENQFGKQFGIHLIPTMWLIGKNGCVADVNARGDLSDKVGKLLEENIPLPSPAN